MDERSGRGRRVIASLTATATAVALAIGLPIFALGERIREREERSLNHPPNSPTRKDLS